MGKHLEKLLETRRRSQIRPSGTVTIRTAPPGTTPGALTVKLWFEAGHGMQASLHIGQTIHFFADAVQLACYLLELADEPEVFREANAG